ncbi:copper resistance CopC/CopD family protein [Planotetraspora kaengkrachanensis]|uniref:Transport integral membrane protein n=1 Tax=Planotetraspora kaengkrachanensis TaxID=575193 RepID=A0A8J3PRM7_9ACTN|nr:copper resistance protein CopC [Planotetraspora kaengkrachanensis]GIG78574.1 transport integral membrane protein [Planotetraspora kaengkrachanensis]
MTGGVHLAGRSRARLITRLAVVAILVACGLVADLVSDAVTRPAYAHAYLIQSSPVDGQVLHSPPADVRLTFNEAVSFNQRSFQLLDVTGKKLAIGAPGYVDGKANTARVSLPASLVEGTYVLAWRITSADSHVVSGAFSFSIGRPSTLAAPVEEDVSPAVPVVDAVGRALAFLGLALALGGALFVAVLWPAGRDDRRGRGIVWSGFAALTAGTVVVLLVQGPYAAGTSLSGVFDPELLSATLSTRLGHALSVRLLIVLVLGVAFWMAVRPSSSLADVRTDGARTPGAGTAGVGAACAVALPFTWTLADHAQTGVQTWLAVPATSLHLLAMALWLGGLITLAACVLLPRRGREPAGAISLEPALPRFSTLAQICFAVIAVTGVYLAWRQVGTLGALGGTGFGQLLLGKLAAVLAVVGLAAGARRFVRRRGRDPLGLDAAPYTAVRRLRRSVAGEVVLGVAVVSITAVLVNTAPARTSYAPPVHATVPIPTGVADAAGPAAGLGGGSLEVKIEPAKLGSNVVDIYITGRNGSLVAVPEVSGALEPRDRSVPALPVKVSAAEPGHYVANSMSIPYPGEWVLRLDIRVSDFDETPVRVPFTAR